MLASAVPLIEIISNTKCRLTDAPSTVLKQIDAALTMEVEGAFHTGATRASGGVWDGKRHFFDPEAGTFPRGLLARMKDLLAQAGLECRVDDLRSSVPPPVQFERIKPDMLKGVRFDGDYAYQLDVIREALKSECGILWLATNAGKTEIACGIMKVLRECRTLFLVGKKGLMYDARNRIAERLGIVEQEIGLIGDSHFSPRHITVALVNSLSAALPSKKGRKEGARAEKARRVKEYLKSVELLFPDECHHTKARTWYKLLQLCPAWYRYALSGTPFGSGNGLMVEAASGPVISRVTNAELVGRGVSARPFIRMTECREPEIDGSGLIYDDVYKQGIVLNTYRNTLIADDAERFAREGKPCLVLVRQLWHGDLLATTLRSRGVKHRFVHANTAPSLMLETLEAFSNKALPVLIASPIFDEGESSSASGAVSWVPAIRGLVVADAGKSPRATLQKVGRAVRRKRGSDNVVEVCDYADCTHKWLARHALERLKIYEEEGFTVTTRQPGDPLIDVAKLSRQEEARRRHISRSGSVSLT